jgi:hypothetical protein
MFGAFLYLAQRTGYTENWSGSIWRSSKCGAEESGEDKMAEKVTNEEFLKCIGEKRVLLNNILFKKAFSLKKLSSS